MKIVKFNEIIEYHTMYTWTFAYRESRRGNDWQRYAIDRFRFRDRIIMVEVFISNIFSSEHRKRIYEQRYKEKKNSIDDESTSPQ